MERVKVLISNRQKKIKIPTGIRLLIRRCCHAVLEFEKMDGDFEVSVSFVDNENIKSLNSQYREKDVPTDVLSFPLGSDGKYDINQETGAQMLGDIVISMEKAVEQTETYGHTLRREVAYLTVHSVLHLIGYDHEDGGIEMVRMREKEEAVLMSLGLPRGESYVLTDET